jgi:hypothetical protein
MINSLLRLAPIALVLMEGVPANPAIIGTRQIGKSCSTVLPRKEKKTLDILLIRKKMP